MEVHDQVEPPRSPTIAAVRNLRTGPPNIALSAHWLKRWRRTVHEANDRSS